MSREREQKRRDNKDQKQEERKRRQQTIRKTSKQYKPGIRKAINKGKENHDNRPGGEQASIRNQEQETSKEK